MSPAPGNMTTECGVRVRVGVGVGDTVPGTDTDTTRAARSPETRSEGFGNRRAFRSRVHPAARAGHGVFRDALQIRTGGKRRAGLSTGSTSGEVARHRRRRPARTPARPKPVPATKPFWLTGGGRRGRAAARARPPGVGEGTGSWSGSESRSGTGTGPSARAGGWGSHAWEGGCRTSHGGVDGCRTSPHPHSFHVSRTDRRAGAVATRARTETRTGDPPRAGRGGTGRSRPGPSPARVGRRARPSPGSRARWCSPGRAHRTSPSGGRPRGDHREPRVRRLP